MELLRISDSIDSKLDSKDIPPDRLNTYKFIPETFESFFQLNVVTSERFIFNPKTT